MTRSNIDSLMSEHHLDAILSISNELSGVYAPEDYPAITLPSGYRDSGEPFGLILVRSALDDQVLINMAYAYEMKYKVRQTLD